MTTRKFVVFVFFGSVTINAFLGIIALVVGDFGDTQGKVLFTSLSVCAASVLSLAMFPTRVRGHLGGIPNIGIETAKWVANKFNNFSEITSAPLEEFTNIKGIGEITGTIIFRWFRVEENLKLINNLQSLGINSENNLKNEKSFELENLTFVITGRLNNITRIKAKNIIEKFGGQTSNSVSKNTNFLVSGKDPGSKLTIARTLNIPILSEQEFLQFLDDHHIKE